MTPLAQWSELAAQQLVRYEALFKLLNDIQPLEDIGEIAAQVATQWKYFANVAGWRLVVSKENGFQIIDGFRAKAQIVEMENLSAWDARHWAHPPRLAAVTMISDEAPPDHLIGKPDSQVMVLPFLRLGACFGLLSVTSFGGPFGDMDSKFIRLFASHFADHVAGILLRRQTLETLTIKATHDPLTELLNRAGIIERLRAQLALSARTGEPLSVILVDIDHFKTINDTHGHATGDMVLREVAHRLQLQTRESDCLGRYGGEEFLIVLYPCGAREAAVAAERLRASIADSAFDISGDRPDSVGVTISLGTAATDARRHVSIRALIAAADAALYRSKSNGRNQVTADPITPAFQSLEAVPGQARPHG